MRRTLSIASLFALILASLFAVACQDKTDPSAAVLVQHQVQPAPPHVGHSTIHITLTDPAGAPISGAHVNMEADMSHPGMAPVFFAAKEAAPGSFTGAVDLNMPGDWTILLHITLASGAKVEKQFDLPGVLAN
ncbi:MAG TPA: FixH family protein [Bryobacteraceae bacterium]|nr:FixH family protein [Bryobacteraceae bacterium]